MRQPKFLAFWSINDYITTSKLKRGLDSLKALGLDGVVFHPRNYPGDPEYLSQEYMDVLNDAILYAKERGMEFWIYDENGWPSGSAGGKVQQAMPELAIQWLECRELKQIKPSEKMICTTDFNDRQYAIMCRERPCVNSLDAAGVKTFIDITFEAYRKGLSPEAFHYVAGFFSDEVAFLDGRSVSISHGGVPWTPDLIDQYKERYHEDILPNLPALFMENGDLKTRIQYWELLSDLLAERFYRPVSNWCEKYGKRYMAHLKAEESPIFQLSFSGSALWQLKEVNTPAIDALERYPGDHYYPRLAVSVARQFGNGASYCEAMGGAGWGTSPKDFVRYIKWLMDNGVTDFCLHLSQLRLNAEAIRDWPPSVPGDVSWSPVFPELLAELRMHAGSDQSDEAKRNRLIVVTPTRGIMAHFIPWNMTGINRHNGQYFPMDTAGRLNREFLELIEDLYKSGFDYDLTEERMMEAYASFTDEGIRLGNSMYRHSVVANGCIWKNPDIEHRLRTQSISKTVGWELLNKEKNTMLLQWEAQQEDGWLRAEIESQLPAEKLTFTVSDPIEDHRLEFREGKLVVWVKPLAYGEQAPFGYISGAFRLVSTSSFCERDARQITTRGPFVLRKSDTPWPQGSAQDLVRAGYPFRSEPFELECCIELTHAADSLLLSAVFADALHVFVNGVDRGWLLEAPWKLLEPGLLKQGQNIIRVVLYPSTYNKYGPHHYWGGDGRIISAAQYQGVKNFLDVRGAPERTWLPEWNFVKVGLGSVILVF